MRRAEAEQEPAGAVRRVLLPSGARAGRPGRLLAQDGGPLPPLHARPLLAQHLRLPGTEVFPSFWRLILSV